MGANASGEGPQRPRRRQSLEHDWNLTPKEAVQLQQSLRSRVVVSKARTLRGVKTLAGADCSFDRNAGWGHAGVIVYSFPELTEIRRVEHRGRVRFPYVPGLLSFREAPLLLEAFGKLAALPDVVVIDGHGLAHPRRVGIASHMGLLLDRPTIGCAKSLLIGEHGALQPGAGSHVPLVHDGQEIGRVLRTRRGCKPVYVSVGHQISLDAATDIIMRCVRTYRIPRPTREADLYVARLKASLAATQ
jgi:deoxyribonuclease V